MPRPAEPRADIDWNSFHMEVNVHVESKWTSQTGTWSEPECVKDPYLRVHSLAPVLHYGQEVFEGLKALRDPDGNIRIFRPDFHASRLNHSSSLVSIPAISTEHFLRCVKLAVQANAEFAPPNHASAMLYIRPFVFGCGASIMLEPADEYLFCVSVLVVGAFHGVKPVDALILEDFDRAAPRGIGSGKVGGNYAPVMRWSKHARSQGFGVTLHLDSQTRTEIEEFSTSTFVGIRSLSGSITLCIPASRSILEGVTCDCIKQLAQSLGWKVECRSVKYEELSEFTEVMACGTAATILPIKSITRKSSGDKFSYCEDFEGFGPLTRKLLAMLQDIQKGYTEDTYGWLTDAFADVDL
ncbi:hypothetical protein B9Z65_5118 [Elsinoe australis]|uniref:Uncharacterized protein n=1 Tax=Elsinoe australis TaxID=40998 RepID=A0A2P7ZD72_9PEZI|nr:hypothetical protein B9Z65_5118 [Elsinoe australis]